MGPSGDLRGFASTGIEGRGKAFLYELHVDEGQRSRGIGSSLLELAERSSGCRGRVSPTVELNVHSDRGGHPVVGRANERNGPFELYLMNYQTHHTPPHPTRARKDRGGYSLDMGGVWRGVVGHSTN